MMAEEDKPSLLSSSGDHIRETAKWLTVSLALLGGVLTAGVQFSSIGSLEPGSARFVTAIYGAITAAVGTALILFGTVWTATTPPARLAELKHKPYFDHLLLQGELTVEELREQYLDAIKTRSTHAKAFFPAGDQGTAVAQPDPVEAEKADDQLRFLKPIIRNVIDVATYKRITLRWKISAVAIGLGALIAGAGIGVFMWATNPPAAVAAAEAAPAVVGEAAQRTLALSPAGQSALAADLGEDCDVTQPLQIAHLDNTDTGPDVVVQQDGCTPLRLIITDTWGEVSEPPPALPAN